MYTGYVCFVCVWQQSVLEGGVQAGAADMCQLEEAMQKWQRAAHKAQRHADACHAEADAKDQEAAEATAQVVIPLAHIRFLIMVQVLCSHASCYYSCVKLNAVRCDQLLTCFMIGL